MISFLEKHSTAIVIILLAILFFVVFTSSLTESQIIDEGTHLASGYSYLVTSDFRMNPEHPPLIKILAGLSARILDPELPINHSSWPETDQWAFAYQFLYHNQVTADDLLLLGRIPIMILSVLLSLSVYLVTKRYFGKFPALLALLFITFEPNLIAHSRYITTDIAITLLFIISIYYFGEYLNRPNLKRLLFCAFFFGLAQVTKFSAVILVPIFFLLLLVKLGHQSRKSFTAKINLRFIALSAACFIIIPLTIIHVAYLGKITVPIDDPDVQNMISQRDQLVQSLENNDQPLNLRVLGGIINPENATGKLLNYLLQKPIPIFHYVEGLYNVMRHNFFGHQSYLMGLFYNTGVWYYFLFAYLVKVPLAFILILAAALIHLTINFINKVRFSSRQILCQREGSLLTQFVKRYSKLIKKVFTYTIAGYIGTVKVFVNLPFHYYLLIVPIIAYLLISMGSGINIGIRHIFPIFPFITIFVAKAISDFLSKSKKKLSRAILLTLLTLYVFSSIKIYPHYLAYFSDLVGGPNQGHLYLIDSNLDWGQDMKNLKNYMETNNIPEIYFAYFGISNIHQYDVAAKYLPKSDQPEQISQIDGFVAISVGQLYSMDTDYDWLLNRQPDDKVGYSIFIYDFRKGR